MPQSQFACRAAQKPTFTGTQKARCDTTANQMLVQGKIEFLYTIAAQGHRIHVATGESDRTAFFHLNCFPLPQQFV